MNLSLVILISQQTKFKIPVFFSEHFRITFSSFSEVFLKEFTLVSRMIAWLLLLLFRLFGQNWCSSFMEGFVTTNSTKKSLQCSLYGLCKRFWQISNIFSCNFFFIPLGWLIVPYFLQTYVKNTRGGVHF